MAGRIAPSMTIMPFLGAFVLFTWLLDVMVKRNPVIWFRQTWLLLAFLALVVMASVASTYPLEELQVIFSYVQLIGLMLLTTNLVCTEATLKKIVFVLITSVTLVSLYSFYSYYLLGKDAIMSQTFLRAYGNTAAPPRLAFYAATGAFLLITSLPYTKKRRILIGIGVLINLLALVSTKDVTVIFAFIAGLMVWLVFSKRYRVSLSWRGLWRVFALGLLIIGLWQLPFVQMLDVSNRISNRINQIKRYDFYYWGSGRGVTWASSVRLIEDNPWFGVGENQMSKIMRNHYWAAPSIFINAPEISPHNLFLSIAGGNGLIAAAIFTLFLFSVFRNLYKEISIIVITKPKYSNMLWIGRGLLGWWGIALVTIMALDYQRHKLLWLFISLSLAYSHILKQQYKEGK